MYIIQIPATQSVNQ